ncbi:MAG: ABC transporter permease [Candidatus Dormibacteraeota bacterium]|nr:ABC transporter permease [Candidatus Dormibacteraeota bacterium]
MRPRPVQVRWLYLKELRQLRRSRTALLTGAFLALMLVVIAPMSQLTAAQPGSGRPLPVPASLPGLAGLHGARDIFLYLSLPVFFVLGGLLTPSVTANFTVVSERERRTLELLVSLPVSVADILYAKLAANLTAAAATLLPLFAIDAVGMLMLTRVGPAYVASALLLLLAALAASVGVSLLLSLLARDFRTSNNLGGAFVIPTMLLTVAVEVLVPGLGRFLVLSSLMLLLGAGAFLAGARWLTFERYLA